MHDSAILRSLNRVPKTVGQPRTYELFNHIHFERRPAHVVPKMRCLGRGTVFEVRVYESPLVSQCTDCGERPDGSLGDNDFV